MYVAGQDISITKNMFLGSKRFQWQKHIKIILGNVTTKIYYHKFMILIKDINFTLL